MIEQIASWITSSVSTIGYPAIFILMTLESALIPIPSEVTMPFAGFLVGLGKMNFLAVVLVGGLGNLVGSLAVYALGFWGQEKVVRRAVRSYGKYLLINLEEVDQAERWFRAHGGKIAFFSRLLPIVRTFISLPAGIAKMNVIKFSLYTLTGSLIWSAFLTRLGVALGQNWNILEVYFRKFEILIVLGGIFLFASYVYRKVQKIKRTS
ncbi:MAG: DedA family protein [Patescibacteria group bacterium]